MDTPQQGRFASLEPIILKQDDLTFSWWEQSPDIKDDGAYDSGMATSLLTATDADGVRRGYLRLSFSSEAVLDQAYTRPLMFFQDHGGWALNDATPQSLWLSAHRHAGTPASIKTSGSHIPGYRLTAEMVPSLSVIERDLHVLDQDALVARSAWLSWAQHPFPAFSRVETLRQGLGTRLYLLAAQHLGTSGRILRASSSRTPAAQALWKHFVASPDIKTSKVAFRYRPGLPVQRFPCLDYRP